MNRSNRRIKEQLKIDTAAWLNYFPIAVGIAVLFGIVTTQLVSPALMASGSGLLEGAGILIGNVGWPWGVLQGAMYLSKRNLANPIGMFKDFKKIRS